MAIIYQTTEARKKMSESKAGKPWTVAHYKARGIV